MKYNIERKKIVQYINYITIETKYFSVTIQRENNPYNEMLKDDVVKMFKKHVQNGIYFSNLNEIILYEADKKRNKFNSSFLCIPWSDDFTPFIDRKAGFDIDNLDNFLDFLLK